MDEAAAERVGALKIRQIGQSSGDHAARQIAVAAAVATGRAYGGLSLCA